MLNENVNAKNMHILIDYQLGLGLLTDTYRIV